MILGWVKLHNIRSYAHEKVDFLPGTMLLSGDIGSGKSTILLAVEFALFGIMRTELSGSSLLRNGESSGTVELMFSISKDEYIVKRGLKRSKNSIIQDSGYIITNGRKFEGTPIELKAKILDILGYPDELITKSKSLIYRYTVYTPQEEMKQILNEEKEVRLETLRKLFGIDKYKTIKENTLIFERELKRKFSELRARTESFDELVKEKEQSAKLANEILEKINFNASEQAALKESIFLEKKGLEELSEEMKRLSEQKRNLEVKTAQLALKNSSRENNSRKIEESSIRIGALKRKLENYSDIGDLKQENSLQEELTGLQDRLLDASGKKTASLERLKALDESISRIEAELSELARLSKESILFEAKVSELKQRTEQKVSQERFLEGLTKKEKEAEIRIEKLGLIIRASEKTISEIKSADICPVCSQKIHEEHRSEVISKQKEAIGKNQEEMKKHLEFLEKVTVNKGKIKRNLDKIYEAEGSGHILKEKLAGLESSLSHLIPKQKELNSLYEKKNHAQEKEKDAHEIDFFKAQIEKKKKELSGIRDYNIKSREKKNTLDIIHHEEKNNRSLIDELEELSGQIAELSDAKKGLERELLGYALLEEKHIQAKSNLEEMRERLNKLEIISSALAQEKKSIVESINHLGERINAMEEIKSKAKEASEIISWLDEFFINLMTTMEKHIMISLHREFNSLLKDWLSTLIEDLDITLDDEFTPVITQDGYETEISSLSGGEKTSVALAYRLALNKVINDIISTIRTKNLIILDEPTDGFSTEQLDKVRDVLRQLNMQQTIIVSHEAKMESYVDNVIRIVKEDGVSRVAV